MFGRAAITLSLAHIFSLDVKMLNLLGDFIPRLHIGALPLDPTGVTSVPRPSAFDHQQNLSNHALSPSADLSGPWPPYSTQACQKVLPYSMCITIYY